MCAPEEIRFCLGLDNFLALPFTVTGIFLPEHKPHPQHIYGEEQHTIDAHSAMRHIRAKQNEEPGKSGQCHGQRCHEDVPKGGLLPYTLFPMCLINNAQDEHIGQAAAEEIAHSQIRSIESSRATDMAPACEPPVLTRGRN